MSGAARSESLPLATGSCPAPIPVVPEQSNNPIWQRGNRSKAMLDFDQAAPTRVGIESPPQPKPSLPFSHSFLVRYTRTIAFVPSPGENRAGPSHRAAQHQEKTLLMEFYLGGKLVLGSWITENIMNFRLRELPLFSLRNKFLKQCR